MLPPLSHLSEWQPRPLVVRAKPEVIRGSSVSLTPQKRVSRSSWLTFKMGPGRAMLRAQAASITCAVAEDS